MTIKQQGGIFGRNPTFNNVDVEGTLTVNGEPISDFGTMAQQDANNVNIDGGAIDGTTLGENTRSTGKFTTANTSSYLTVESSAGSGLRMYGSSGTNQWDVYLNSTNLRFSDNTGGGVAQFDTNVNLNNSNLVIGTSGKGIDFSATSGTGTSELFDDYEEGTFTPTLYGNATAGTYELATASGTYTKVGRVVTAQVLLVLAGSVTGGGSGDTVIGGLPFTYDGSENPGQHSAVASGGISFAAGATVTASRITSSDDTRLTLYESVAGTSIATVPITDFGANDLVSFTVTYFSI